MKLAKAVLQSGKTIEYVDEDPKMGGMKSVYFTPDRSSVVCFFLDKRHASDPERMRRLEAIVGRYNPTRNAANADYWSKLFCWPTDVVVQPELGIVAPVYPGHFFFASGPVRGVEKNGKWFSSPKLRTLFPPEELGRWLNYLQICICIARGVVRMHVAGLSHSDLSNNNVLVDPTHGSAIIIDIDSLVVPGLYPPDVIGTPGYIAPEVLSTLGLDLDDPARVLPSSLTDLHALAVLIYEYLLLRHPLVGGKIHAKTAEEDDHLAMGANALFIEHPIDKSNRPQRPIKHAYTVLGPYLKPLIERAFVDGLHNPSVRPMALEWEKALVRTTDLLLPCCNAYCAHQWFVYDGAMQPSCTFCGSVVKGTTPILNLYRETRPGQFSTDNHRLVVWNNQSLYRWHLYDNVFPGAGADKTQMGYFALHEKRWYLVNTNTEPMQVINGDPVSPGKPVELKDGQQIRFANASHSRLAVVQMAGSD